MYEIYGESSNMTRFIFINIILIFEIKNFYTKFNHLVDEKCTTANAQLCSGEAALSVNRLFCLTTLYVQAFPVARARETICMKTYIGLVIM